MDRVEEIKLPNFNPNLMLQQIRWHRIAWQWYMNEQDETEK